MSELNETALEEAAKEVCEGRSDEWMDKEDRQNARDDARTAVMVYLQNASPTDAKEGAGDGQG